MIHTDTLQKIDHLDEHELLMLADYIADKLSEDLADSILPGIAQAFDALEEGCSYTQPYPASYPATSRDHWKRWNAYRNQSLHNALDGALAATRQRVRGIAA